MKSKFEELFPSRHDDFGLFMVLFQLMADSPSEKDLQAARKRRELLYKFLEEYETIRAS